MYFKFRKYFFTTNCTNFTNFWLRKFFLPQIKQITQILAARSLFIAQIYLDFCG